MRLYNTLVNALKEFGIETSEPHSDLVFPNKFSQGEEATAKPYTLGLVASK